jgi:hypothetical protein
MKHSGISGSATLLLLLFKWQSASAQENPQYAPCLDALDDPNNAGSDTLFIEEFQTYVLTMATSEILIRGDIGALDSAKLKESLIDDRNMYKFDYYQRLPPYSTIPNPAINIFYKFACDNTLDDSPTITDFCATTSGPAPDALAIPLSQMTDGQRGRAVKRICNRFAANWDSLVSNVESHYRSQGLIGGGEVDAATEDNNESTVDENNESAVDEDGGLADNRKFFVTLTSI